MFVCVCALTIEDVAKVKVMLHGRQFPAARYGVTFVYHFRLCFGKMSDAFVFRCSERINKNGNTHVVLSAARYWNHNISDWFHTFHRHTRAPPRYKIVIAHWEGGKTACQDSIYLQHWTRLIAINGHVNGVPAVSAELHTNGSK